jgi:AcrR family transcriptional regulator
VERKLRTREALLRAARAVLKRQGYQGTTTRLIAREAKVATGTFFVHFADVAALVEALLDEHLEAALAKGFKTLPPGDLLKRLVHVSMALYASYAREPELARAAIEGSLFQSDASGPTARRLASYSQWVAHEVSAAVSQGRVPDIDPQLAVTSFFSLYFGLLVGGLRGDFSGTQQRRLLTCALQRLFLTSSEHP